VEERLMMRGREGKEKGLARLLTTKCLMRRKEGCHRET